MRPAALVAELVGQVMKQHFPHLRIERCGGVAIKINWGIHVNFRGLFVFCCTDLTNNHFPFTKRFLRDTHTFNPRSPDEKPNP
jgi:hypothetical protein